MRSRFLVNAALSIATILGSARASGAQPVAGLLPPVQLSAVTWNIRIGEQTDAAAREDMDFLAALSPRPRVVLLNEASQARFSTYMTELSLKTGEPWAGVFQPHCALDSWNGSVCTKSDDEGVAILTSLPLLFKEGRVFPYPDCWHSARAAAHATVQVGLSVVQLFTTHLQTGGCFDDQQSRLNSVADLKRWAMGFPAMPLLIGGDFNALPSSPEISDPSRGMASMFSDAWLQAGEGNGYTFDSAAPFKRIDYWFVGANRLAVTKGIQVPFSTLSDHLPVAATFETAKIPQIP